MAGTISLGDVVAGAAPGTGGPLRLSPELASFRALVLTFVRRYLETHGISPSYGEIAAGVGGSRKRIHKHVCRLADDGLLLRTPGPRGLALPAACDDALRRLIAAGWHVDAASGALLPPGVTNQGLQPPPVLDYP